jgi:hypothetical protein
MRPISIIRVGARCATGTRQRRTKLPALLERSVGKHSKRIGVGIVAGGILDTGIE